MVTAAGRLSKRMRVPTTIPALTEAIGSVRRPRWAVMEEGPLAGWLSRHLAAQVDERMVCDPRRNALLAKDSDKDDPIDAEKRARLRRGGFGTAGSSNPAWAAEFLGWHWTLPNGQESQGMNEPVARSYAL